MNTFIWGIVLLFLFYILDKGASLAISALKNIAQKLGIQIFLLGLVLGLLTTVPEVAICFNAIINNVPRLSLGNLWGGIIVILSLVLGLNIVLNRKILTDGKISHFLPVAGYVFLPLLLGLKKNLGYFDGAILILLYFVLFYYLYRENASNAHNRIVKIFKIRRDDTAKNILKILGGMLVVVVVSSLIVKITTIILDEFKVAPFIIGLLIFSIGTNLPELIIALGSWKQGAGELSLSYIIGSSMANVLIVGLLTTIKPVELIISPAYYLTMISMAIILLVLLLFYKTGKRFSRREGFVLILLYLLFLAGQIFFLKG